MIQSQSKTHGCVSSPHNFMKQMLKLVISHRISSHKFGESGFGVPLAKLRSGSYFNKPVIDSSCKAPNRFLNIPGSQILKKCLTNRSTNLGLPTFRIFIFIRFLFNVHVFSHVYGHACATNGLLDMAEPSS